MFKRLIASLVCLTFLGSNLQYVHAQDFSVNQLPIPGSMIGESAPFAPLALKGLVVNPQKPLEFQFIVDTGKGPQDTAAIKDQANQLVKYFLAGLTIPEGDLWVNLSPYEKSRIVPAALGQTDLGRDLLAQDYILKQLTASLIYPEKDLGKEFWNRVYAKAQKQFGTTNVPVNTFNKVWILPDKAQVFENISAAYVTKATLKVMLDEDYLAKQRHQVIIPRNDTSSIGANIVRQIILPEIEIEVNTGKNFGPLRQIYQALILAKWYKETIQNGLLDALYTNKNKVAGVDLHDPAVKEQIYDRYLKAYKKGAFNYIKESPTPEGQFVPRKYFSGGTRMVIAVDPTGKKEDIHGPDGAMISLTVVLGRIAAGVARAFALLKSSNSKPNSLDYDLVREALSNGAIPLHKIKDKRLAKLLTFLSDQNINDVVVFGGAVRDIFFNKKSRDIDFGIRIPMTDEERRLASNVGAQATAQMHASALNTLQNLAHALKVPVERFFDKDNPPQFNGISLHYLGPTLNPSTEGSKPVIFQGFIADKASRQIFSSSTVPGFLQIAIDNTGFLYGYQKPLADALNGQVNLQGDLKYGRNLSLGVILKWLRLKYVYGFTLSPQDYSLVRRVINEGETIRLYDPKLIHQEMQNLVNDTVDRLSVMEELKDLGIIEITRFVPRLDFAMQSKGKKMIFTESTSEKVMLTLATAVPLFMIYLLVNFMFYSTDNEHWIFAQMDFYKKLSVDAYYAFTNHPKITAIGLGLVPAFLAWQNYSLQGLSRLLKKGSTDDEEVIRRLKGKGRSAVATLIEYFRHSPSDYNKILPFLVAMNDGRAIEPIADILGKGQGDFESLNQALVKLGADRETIFQANLKAFKSSKYGQRSIKFLGDWGDPRAIGAIADELGKGSSIDACNQALRQLNANKEVIFQANLKAVSNNNAIEFLGNWGDPRAIRAIAGELAKGYDTNNKAKNALVKLRASKEIFLEAYIELASKDQKHSVAESELLFAIEWLANSGDRRAINPLILNLGHTSYSGEPKAIRKAARAGLIKLNADKEVLFQANLKLASSDDYRTRDARLEAVEWLGNSGDKRAVPVLLSNLESYDGIRVASRISLAKLGIDRETMYQTNIGLLSSRDEGIRREAVSELGTSRDGRAISHLFNLLRKDSDLRPAIAKALRALERYYKLTREQKVLLNLVERQPPGAQGNLFSFEKKALDFAARGYDFSVIYEAEQSHWEPSQYQYDPGSEVIDSVEVLDIKEGALLPPDAAMSAPEAPKRDAAMFKKDISQFLVGSAVLFGIGNLILAHQPFVEETLFKNLGTDGTVFSLLALGITGGLLTSFGLMNLVSDISSLRMNKLIELEKNSDITAILTLQKRAEKNENYLEYNRLSNKLFILGHPAGDFIYRDYGRSVPHTIYHEHNYQTSTYVEEETTRWESFWQKVNRNQAMSALETSQIDAAMLIVTNFFLNRIITHSTIENLGSNLHKFIKEQKYKTLIKLANHKNQEVKRLVLLEIKQRERFAAQVHEKLKQRLPQWIPNKYFRKFEAKAKMYALDSYDFDIKPRMILVPGGPGSQEGEHTQIPSGEYELVRGNKIDAALITNSRIIVPFNAGSADFNTHYRLDIIDYGDGLLALRLNEASSFPNRKSIKKGVKSYSYNIGIEVPFQINQDPSRSFESIYQELWSQKDLIANELSQILSNTNDYTTHEKYLSTTLSKLRIKSKLQEVDQRDTITQWSLLKRLPLTEEEIKELNERGIYRIYHLLDQIDTESSSKFFLKSNRFRAIHETLSKNGIFFSWENPAKKNDKITNDSPISALDFLSFNEKLNTAGVKTIGQLTAMNFSTLTKTIGLFGANQVRRTLMENGLYLESSAAMTIQQEDHAQTTVNPEYGGIDLNQIHVLRNGKKVLVHFDPAQLSALEQGGFEGFTPIITGFQYIKSPFPLLGLNMPKKEIQLAKA